MIGCVNSEVAKGEDSLPNPGLFYFHIPPYRKSGMFAESSFLSEALATLPIPDEGVPYFELVFSQDPIGFSPSPYFLDEPARKIYISGCRKNGILPFSRLEFLCDQGGSFSFHGGIGFQGRDVGKFSVQDIKRTLRENKKERSCVAELCFRSSGGGGYFPTFVDSVLPELVGAGYSLKMGDICLTGSANGDGLVMGRTTIELGTQYLVMALHVDEADREYWEKKLQPWVWSLKGLPLCE